MAELFANGRIVDAILGLVLVELSALILIRMKTRRGLNPRDLVAGLLPGVGLLLALRAALLGDPWRIIALCLGVALIAHVYDLARRWTTA
jgi:hypothetical protein